LIPRSASTACVVGEKSSSDWLHPAHLDAELLNKETPASITGVFIAATGLRHQSTVVSNNTKDFRRMD
jgi:predicted nucleic acid-binding protein